MPRKGRGGPRSGNPGTAYANRTDLAADTQPVAVPTGQPYGEAGRQESAMRQMGIPDLQAQLQALPGLLDPSARPEEPLTAGMPMGPGPGMDPMRGAMRESGGLGLLRRLVAANPSPELFDLLAEAERSAPQQTMMPGI